MPNAVRHVLGLVAGLILAPATAIGLFYGTARMVRLYQSYAFVSGDQWVPTAVLAVVGVALGAAVGSRISPLASLIPGLLFAGVGGLWMLAPNWMLHNSVHKLPDQLDRGFQIVGPYGVLLLLGLVLVVGSLWPSRWRARERPSDGQAQEVETPAAGSKPGIGLGSFGSSAPQRPQYLQTPQTPQGPQEGWPPANRGQGPAVGDQGPVYDRGPIPRRLPIGGVGPRSAPGSVPDPRSAPDLGRGPVSGSGSTPGYPSGEDQDPPNRAIPPRGRSPFRSP